MTLLKRLDTRIESIPRERQVLIGLGLVFASSLVFSWGNLFLKRAADELSPVTVAFWRGIIGLAIVVCLANFDIRKLIGVNRAFLLARGLLGTLAMTLFFISVKSTTLSNAIGLFNTYPIFTTLFGILFFKERWHNVYVFALILSLGGIWFIVRPDLGFFGRGELISLVCVFFVGWVINLVRHLRKTDSVLSIIFYFTASTTVVYALPVSFNELAVSLSYWPWLLAVGFLTTLAQLLMTAGYTYCTASGGSIVSLLGLPLTLLLSNTYLDEKLGWYLGAGSFLIFFAGFLIAFARREEDRDKEG